MRRRRPLSRDEARAWQPMSLTIGRRPTRSRLTWSPTCPLTAGSRR